MLEKTLAFFVTSIITFDLFIVETNFLYSVIAGVVVGLIAILMFNYLQGDYNKIEGREA